METTFKYFLILENRKDDLYKKFQQLGDIGEELYNTDTTPNKAYLDWLFKFYSDNKSELDEINNLPDIIKNSINKYHNNYLYFIKQGLPITNIKTIKQLRKTLDRKDHFDDIEKYDKNDVIIWMNSLEWLVFQPYTYKISQLAYRKDRKKNWCTTHVKEHFKGYFGYKGAILYCTNKLDSKQDIAFELLPNWTMKVWDYKDDTNITASLYEMKHQFEENTDIYNLFDEIEHEIKIPKFTKEELQQRVKNYYSDLDITIDDDILYDFIESEGILSNYNDTQISFYIENTADLASEDPELTIEWLKKHVNVNKLCNYFGCDLDDLDEYMNDDMNYITDLLDNFKIPYRKFVEDNYTKIESEEIVNQFFNKNEFIDTFLSVSQKDKLKELQLIKMTKDLSYDDMINILFQ